MKTVLTIVFLLVVVVLAVLLMPLLIKLFYWMFLLSMGISALILAGCFVAFLVGVINGVT